jgi:hypothetical protein
MTSKAIDPKGDTTGATHWSVYDDDPRVDRHFGPFESQAEAEAFAREQNSRISSDATPIPASVKKAFYEATGEDFDQHSASERAEIYAAAFEAGFGFCNYAHNLGYDHPLTAEEQAEVAQQEADREAYKAALLLIGRGSRLPLGYPFTLSGLGL